MSELERRALLGDRQTQEECTERWIALPCPKCGKSVQRFETVASLCCLDPKSKAYDDLGKYFGVVCNTLKGGCGIFVCGEEEVSIKSALAEWNTRPAPPIGRCEDCKYYTLLGHCKIHSQEPDEYGPGAYVEMLPDDFCSCFEPKRKELARLQPLEGVGSEEGTRENCAPGTEPERSFQ